MEKGRIIFLNGVTSSGKTSIVEVRLVSRCLLFVFKRLVLFF